MSALTARTSLRFVALVIVTCLAITLGGCQPSEADRERELKTFVESLANGTTTWERYVPNDKLASVLKAKSAVTTDFEILGWDHASVCCGLGNDLYEYRVRFSNGTEAVSYISVEDGRVSQITLDLYDPK